MSEDDAQESVCTHCCLKVGEPLSCGHLVCKDCIINHIDDETTEYPCPVCSHSKQCLQTSAADWLNIEGGNHKFLVLVFCRGDWGYFCEVVVREMDEITNSIRNMGGELFCIGKESKEIANIAQNVYKPKLFVYGDSKDTLYKEFKLEKKAGVTDYLLKLSPRSRPTSNDPHIIIINRKQRELLFNWSPERGRFSPQSVLQMCLYHFSHTTVKRSKDEYVATNSHILFQKSLKYHISRKNFYHFAVRGPLSNCVRFLVDVEVYESLSVYNDTNHRRSRGSSAEEKSLEICSKYLIPGSDFDILDKLSPDIATLYKKVLVLDDFKAHCIKIDEGCTEYKELTEDGNLFEKPTTQIKEMLYATAFLQFTISDMFVKSFPEIVNSSL